MRGPARKSEKGKLDTAVSDWHLLLGRGKMFTPPFVPRLWDFSIRWWIVTGTWVNVWNGRVRRQLWRQVDVACTNWGHLQPPTRPFGQLKFARWTNSFNPWFMLLGPNDGWEPSFLFWRNFLMTGGTRLFKNIFLVQNVLGRLSHVFLIKTKKKGLGASYAFSRL